MDELTWAIPGIWQPTVGPVIDAAAQAGIRAHIDQPRAEGRGAQELQRRQAAPLSRPTLIR